jgi:hypothetical protein
VRCRYLEQQRAVVPCLGKLGAHLWPVDESFAWNHVIHKVADPIRQLDRDQPIPKLRQQVHGVWPADLIVRRVVAKPEPLWIERFEGSTNQLGRRPGQHIFERQADVRRRQDRNEIFTVVNELIEAVGELGFGKVERAAVNDQDRHAEFGSGGNRPGQLGRTVRSVCARAVNGVNGESVMRGERSQVALASGGEIVRVRRIGTQ